MGGFGSKPSPINVMVGEMDAPAESSSGGLFSGSMATYLVVAVGTALLLYLLFVAYNWLRRRQGLEPISLTGGGGSGDKTPTPVDGKTKTVISAAELPASGSGSHGIQFWMFIKDWDYKFGQTKDVLKRVSSTNAAHVVPRVSLSPSENTLDVAVSLFPASGQASRAVSGLSASGDVQTCSVENVPLQAWFSVSITVFQRNMDIYINGRLVKSCVLPGVPKPVVGDIILNDNGGFSGSICNLNWYNAMLSPDESKAFHAKGTQCAPPAAAGLVKVDEDSLFITLFGYTFRFSKIGKDGKELSSYTF